MRRRVAADRHSAWQLAAEVNAQLTAAAPTIPQALRNQLADGGRLVIPVGGRDLQQLMLAVRRGNEWHESSHGACVFVPLVGPGGFEE